MALFQGSPVESPFPSENALLNMTSGRGLQQSRLNDLMLQQHQQEIASTDQEMVARAAAYLNGLPEDQRAAAYGPVVQDLQSRGFAKQAPFEYPGHERIAALASMGTPSKDILSMSVNRDAAAAYGRSLGLGGAAPAAGGGADPVAGMPREQALDAIKQRESGGRNVNTEILGPDGKPASSASGFYQMIDSTWRDGAKLAGVDVTQYPRAIDAPEAVQRQVAGAILDRDGVAPWAASAPSRGVAARTGGMDVAGPGAPSSGGASAPAAAGFQPLLPSGLTADQEAQVRVRLGGRNPDINAISDDVRAMQKMNVETRRQVNQDAATAAERDYQHGRNTQADKLAAETAARQADAEAMKPDNLLVKYRDKIADGTATEPERLLYSIGAQHYLKPVPTWVDSVTEPGKKELVNLPGQLPEGFPPPTYRPNQAQPAPSQQLPQQAAPAVPQAPVAPAAAPVLPVPAPPAAASPGPYPWSVAPPPVVKSDQRVSKPIEVTDRKALLDESKRLDQVVNARDTFQNDYGGYGAAAVGDFANTIARNTPGESPRADWWQNYQRIKLAARQSISGQSLTESEKQEFEKADINPGMSAETIRANLKRQDDLLRIGLARHVRSLVGDNYSKAAVEEASGVKFDDTSFKAAGEGLGKSAQPPDAPREAGQRTKDTVYMTPKGPLRWTGTGWVPAGG